MKVAFRQIDEQRVGNNAVRQPRRRGHTAAVEQIVAAADDGVNGRVVPRAPVIDVVLTGRLVDDVIAHPDLEIHVGAAVFDGIADAGVGTRTGIRSAVEQGVVIDVHRTAAWYAKVGLSGDVDTGEIPAAIGRQRAFAHAVNDVVVDLDLSFGR